LKDLKLQCGVRKSRKKVAGASEKSKGRRKKRKTNLFCNSLLCIKSSKQEAGGNFYEASAGSIREFI